MIAQAHNFPTGPALLDDPLFRAAEHRAKGHDWDQTAKHLGIDCRTLRLLTFAEPERWKKLSREAEREYFRETGRQSVSFMRVLMHSEVEKTCLAASVAFAKLTASIHRHTPKARRATGETPYQDPFEAFSDEELDMLIEGADRQRDRGMKGDDEDDEADPNRPVKNPPRDPSGAGGASSPSPLEGEGGAQHRVRGSVNGEETPHPAAKRGDPLPQRERVEETAEAKPHEAANLDSLPGFVAFPTFLGRVEEQRQQQCADDRGVHAVLEHDSVKMRFAGVFLQQPAAGEVGHERPDAEDEHVEQPLGAAANVFGEVLVHEDVDGGEEEGVADAVEQDHGEHGYLLREEGEDREGSEEPTARLPGYAVLVVGAAGQSDR